MPYETTGYASISLANNPKIIGLAELCRVLLGDIIDIDYTPAPLYHITLGYGDNASIEILQDIAQGFTFACFDIPITEFDVFENEGVNYLVALCELTPDLFSLQATIYGEMVKNGIALSEYHFPPNFLPHITLGTFEGTIPLETLNEFLGTHFVHAGKVVFSIGDYTPVAINRAVELFSPDEMSLLPSKSIFKILNDNDWLAWYTNNFEDKEGEIISEKALREFVDGANSGKYPMPELWFYHIQGTKHGIAKQLFQVGHFTVAYGEFDDSKDNKFVEAMKIWYDKQDMITMSHWFYFDDSSFKNGVYEKIRTFEISTLPAHTEANALTNFIYEVKHGK